MRLTEQGGVIMPSAKRYGWPTCIFLLATLLWCIPLTARADTKAITAEGAYTMGDGETPIVAELRALQQAKRQALEQAGIYIQSYTKGKDYDLTIDEIETVSAGIMEVEVLEKKRDLVGDGLRFSVKIKATVTTERADELVSRLRQKSPDDSLNLVGEYKRLKDDYVRLATEIDAFKRQMTESKSAEEKQQTASLIAEKERRYQARELYESCLVPSTNFDAIIACLDEVIFLDPRFVDAWDRRGFYGRVLQKYQQSISDFTEAIRLDPLPSRYLRRGNVFFRFGKLAQAIDDADEAIRLDPNNSDGGYAFRAVCYFEEGKYAEAVDDYTRAIKFPARGSDLIDTSDLYNRRGTAHVKLRQYQQAIADFTQAIKAIDGRGTTEGRLLGAGAAHIFDPRKAMTLLNRGEAYAFLGMLDEAVGDYRQACVLGDKEACGLPERR